ncbi:hypothetical protein ACFLSQ_07165 [Bacteroidota bacterium]
MKKPACILLVLFSIIFLTQSCEDNSTNPTIVSDVLMPLNVGNYWINKVTEYNPQGNVISIDTVHGYVAMDSIWNNEKIYRMSITSNESAYDNSFILNRNTGVYLLNPSSGENEPLLYLKYPAVKGDFFLFRSDTMWVEEIDVEYTVPAGTFKCYKYKNQSIFDDSTIYKEYHYYSPGTGPITSETYYEDENTKMYLEYKWELIEYKIK